MTESGNIVSKWSDLDDSSYGRRALFAHLMSIANLVIVGACVKAGPKW